MNTVSEVDAGPKGAPPFQPLETAYAELLTGLWFAHHQFRQEGDGGLQGMRTACHAVTRFIAVRHENPELASTFIRMHGLIGDVQAGVLPEIFAGRPASERSRSSLRSHSKMQAAAALEVLVRLGEPLDKASKRVAGHVRHWPGMENAKITGTTIENWRNDWRAKTSEERAEFDALRDYVLSLPDPKAVAANWLGAGPPSLPKS